MIAYTGGGSHDDNAVNKDAGPKHDENSHSHIHITKHSNMIHIHRQTHDHAYDVDDMDVHDDVDTAKAKSGGINHKIAIRRPEAHDEPDPVKRVKLQKLRNFLANIRWSKIDNETGDVEEAGTTWIELYILYCIHGGWNIGVEAEREAKLENATSLTAAMKKFKAEVKLLKRHCVEEKDEAYLDTSYARANRLRPLAVTNKHAMLRGVPCISESEACTVTKAILAMKGIHQRKHKVAWEEGS